MDLYVLFEIGFVVTALVMIFIGVSSSGSRRKDGEKFAEKFKQEHKTIDAAASVMISEAEEVFVRCDNTFKVWKVSDIAYVNYDTTKNSFNNPRRYIFFMDADRNMLVGKLFAPKGKVEAYQNSDYICLIGDSQIKDVHALLSRHNTNIKLLKDGVEQF